jgi:FkbM family methyltransferase
MLNALHRKGFRRLLAHFCQLAYLLKGFGYVRSTYHPAFRAYEYKVNGIVFMSLGPGWAYNFDYLKNALHETYGYQYAPRSGDCVVDIGAGLGEETVIYALLVGKKGKVHAVEANPSTYGGLKYMCDQNKFTWVTPHHIAIYKIDGEVTIEDDDENYLTNTINPDTSERRSFVVNARSLDSLVKEHNITCIDFLKSNIEGAEQYLIEGMRDSIKIIRNCCISCHDFRHVFHQHGEFYLTKKKIKYFLESNGFEITTRNTGNCVVDDYIYARNTRLKCRRMSSRYFPKPATRIPDQ